MRCQDDTNLTQATAERLILLNSLWIINPHTPYTTKLPGVV